MKDGVQCTFVAKAFHQGESESGLSDTQNGIYVKQEVRRAKQAIIVAKDFMTRAKKTNTNTHGELFRHDHSQC
jgi:hypothetical protein